MPNHLSESGIIQNIKIITSKSILLFAVIAVEVINSIISIIHIAHSILINIIVLLSSAQTGLRLRCRFPRKINEAGLIGNPTITRAYLICMLA